MQLVKDKNHKKNQRQYIWRIKIRKIIKLKNNMSTVLISNIRIPIIHKFQETNKINKGFKDFKKIKINQFKVKAKILKNKKK